MKRLIVALLAASLVPVTAAEHRRRKAPERTNGSQAIREVSRPSNGIGSDRDLTEAMALAKAGKYVEASK
jgi:hypothetical protein